MDRIFELGPFLFLLIAVVGAGIAAAMVGKADPGSAGVPPTTRLGVIAETIFLTLFGGFVARIFIGLLLEAFGEGGGARLLIGWAFFLIPGIVDTGARIFFDAQPLTSASAVLWYGTVVGAFTGFMAGLHQIYDWKKFGILQLVGDTTWGLAGSTTGGLVAFINVFIGTPAGDKRKGAHRYDPGFNLKEDFAFTQGNVMSRLSDREGDPLWKHERLHVFQNRLFGPGFILSYIAWMAVWIIPSFVASLAKRDPSYIEGWTYRSNPWEVWAYYIQRKAASQAEGNDFRSGGKWSAIVLREASAIVYSVPFFILFCALAALAVGSA